MKTVKIEMIHDVVCSWCHIGYHNLNRALQTFKTPIHVEMHYLPLQLNPDLPPEGIDIVTHLRERNHWNAEQATTYRKDLLAKAEALGVTIDFTKRTRYYNTANAHRLILFARQTNRHREVHELLLNAYHVQGKNIAEPQVLANLAQQAGVDYPTLFVTDNLAAINQHMAQAQQRIKLFTVRSVPAFVFNDTRFVSGSNNPAFFENILREEIEHCSTAQKDCA